MVIAEAMRVDEISCKLGVLALTGNYAKVYAPEIYSFKIIHLLFIVRTNCLPLTVLLTAS